MNKSLVEQTHRSIYELCHDKHIEVDPNFESEKKLRISLRNNRQLKEGVDFVSEISKYISVIRLPELKHSMNNLMIFFGLNNENDYRIVEQKADEYKIKVQWTSKN